MKSYQICNGKSLEHLPHWPYYSVNCYVFIVRAGDGRSADHMGQQPQQPNSMQHMQQQQQLPKPMQQQDPQHTPQVGYIKWLRSQPFFS
jgi:hypothetical protein